jgi:hypothetical protein
MSTDASTGQSTPDLEAEMHDLLHRHLAAPASSSRAPTDAGSTLSPDDVVQLAGLFGRLIELFRRRRQGGGSG